MEESVKQVPFVHLHLHTEYSLLDGAARLKKGKADSPLFEECIKLGMPGVAITDHGNIMAAFTEYELHKKYQKKLKEGQKFDVIYGCEFYTVPDMTVQDVKEERNHLVLLVKSDQGIKNLIKLTSLAYLDGFYYKPRIDLKLLEKYSEGLICLSACLAGAIPQRLLHNQYNAAKEYALNLQRIFGKDDFYIELQDHNIIEEKQVLPQLVKLADEIGAKVVATNDVHYIKKDDAKAQDVMMCIQTGARLKDERRMKFDSDEFYLKSYEEMYQLFSWREDALTNTIEILNKCKGLSFKEHQEDKLYPAYTCPDNLTPKEYLHKLTMEGLKRRYKDKLNDEIIKRAEEELYVINTKGFDSYYLVVWDFINYSKTNDIPIGPGRGSGVGSIVAYAIGITNVEPLQFDLLFERFLNPERNSPPDFDIDICTERRGEVIDYVVKKYGRERVCQILTLGTLKPKNAIRDVGRVYDIPLDVVNSTLKFLPNDPKMTITSALGEAVDKHGDPIPGISEFIEVYNTNDAMREVINMARKLEGMPKNCSMHAAGVVICQSEVTEEVPVLTAKKKDKVDVITQFQKGELETQGVLKMDFLGLITLTDIHHAIKYVEEEHGVKIDFDELGVNDPNVFEMISQGDTDLVFQLENGGMRKFMTQLKPRNIEDVIIGISLYRPGPMDSIGDFLKARENPSEIHYAHECLKDILQTTSGYFVYQEQVMNVARIMSTYTLGEADILRRCMGKKDAKEMDNQRIKFLKGAEEKGIDTQVANATFDIMERFATYAFNKSHAAAYAHLSYQTAYLRRYYNVEFVCAYLNNRINKSDQLLKYLNIAKNHGVEILPADINKSYKLFKVENGKIRFGLTAIKNIGEQVAEEIVKERLANGEYKSLTDFVDRLDVKIANKTTIENLTKAGAMDSLNLTRATVIANYPAIISKVANDHKSKESGQTSMFDFMPEEQEERLTMVKEFDKLTLLSMEKEVLNTYMSGHPLEEYREEIAKYEFNIGAIASLLKSGESQEEEDEDAENEIDEEAQLEREQILANYDNKQVVLVGLLDNLSNKKTKKGDTMCVGKVSDLYGTVDVVFFAKTYETCKTFLKNDAVVEISGTLQFKEEGPSINVRKCSPLKKGETTSSEQEENQTASHKIVFLKANDFEPLNLINNKIYHIVGGVDNGEDIIRVQYKGKLHRYPCKINITEALILMLKDKFGEEGVIVKEQ